MPKKAFDRLIDSSYAQVRRSSALPGTASATIMTGLTTLQVQEQIDASLVGHRSEADPHAVYLTQSEGDGLYSPLGHNHDSRYYTESESDSLFVKLASAGTITARHTFSPGSAASPFILGANAQGQTVVGLKADQLNRTVTAGAGLSGAGALTSDITISLGAPSSLSSTTTNSASGSTHSHAIDSTIARSAITFSASGLGLSGGGNLTANRTYTLTSDSAPGANAAILASDASGKLTLPLYVATTSVTTPAVTSSAALALTTSSGNISLDASTDVITIGASNTLKSANYASQTTGWGIDYTGGADFRYVYADELHAKSFIADLEQALAGGQIISKSVAVLAVDFTAPAAGGTATLRVKDLPSAANMAVFQSGDIVRLRKFSRASGSLTIADCWGVVTSYADQSDGTQTWTFTRSTSTNAGAMTTGTVVNADSIVLDYGTTGNGIYEVNAIDGAYAANSPYWQIASWSGHPATGQTVNVRGGKLTGITSVANEYGLFAGTGSTASDSYIRVSSYAQESNNLASTWKTGGSTFLSIDATNGAQIESVNSLTSSNQRAYSFTIAGAESGGLYHYYNSTYTEAVMMLNQSSASRNNNIFVQTESDSGKNSRIYLEAKETTQATAYIDLQADVGGNASGIQMGAYTISAYTSQILVKYANGSGGDGFASAPVYSFVDDTNTGIYRSAADTLNISTGGASRVTIGSASFAVHQNTANPIYAGYSVIGEMSLSGNVGFSHKDRATSTDYSFLSGSTGHSYINGKSGALIHHRINNTDVMVMNDVGLRIGSGTEPTHELDVTGTAYVTGNGVVTGALYTGGIIEGGYQAIAGNLSQATFRYSTQAGISLAATSWGYASHIGFNAYLADRSGSYSESGAWKYVGAQYTGDITAPGRLTWDGNANEFRFAVGETGLASGESITSWSGIMSFSADAFTWSGNTDNTATFGRAKIGYVGYSDHAGFSHYDMASVGNYALLQNSTGTTFLNSASGQRTRFRINNVAVGNMGATGLRVGDDTAATEMLDVVGNAVVSGSLDVDSFAATWSNLTYNTNWSSYGGAYSAVKYCRIGDLVMVTGMAKKAGGAGTATVTIGTLPVGYRPTTQKAWYTKLSVGSVESAYNIEVTTGGAIAITLSTTSAIDYVSLDCIQFRINS